MNSKPKIAVVDEEDNVIAYKDRTALGDDDIYRVSALWITNSKGEILLARRHRNKAHHPGKWGPAVAGTVEEGETYEENILKETEEELGLKDVPLTLGPKAVTKGQYHHFTQWFFLQIDRDAASFVLQEDEVEEVRWMAPEALNQDLRDHPEYYLPSLSAAISLLSK